MSEETNNEQQQAPVEDGSTEEVATTEASTTVALEYAGTSQVLDEGEGARVALFGNRKRQAVRVLGSLKEPLAMRQVVQSDNRRKPKDRTAYLAYQRQSASGGSGGANVFQAQREYFEWLEKNDATGWFLLDPIITAHPDQLLFEVFSKDEGSYARMSIDWSALELEGDVTYGTTNIDFSDELHDSVRRMRSYRDTRLSIGPDEVVVQTGDAPAAREKKVDVPNTWLRGFLQVQASATLPHKTFSLAPVDLYNVLRHLRLNADHKKGGRAIRVELVPGEHPRLVLEPWEEVIETSHAPYKGRVAQVIRIWGRRRLQLLRRLLPFIDSVDVHLLATGLPSFYVLRCGPITFTIGLTGFTASNWSQALGLDTLLPRTTKSTQNLEKVITFLQKDQRFFASLEDLSEGLNIGRADLREALQVGCQNGQLMYDLAREVYRLRPVSEQIDLDALQYRNARERLAHDLLAGKGGSVKIVSTNRIIGVGTQYVGEVAVEADRREYRCEMTIDEEGRVKRVDDTSPFFRKHQLKEGPSAPLIALRLKIAEEQQKRAAERGKGSITYETRTYVKRHEKGEDVYQISLEERRLKIRWGLRRMEKLRSQNLMFNNIDDARQAYFDRIRDLESKGYMDATAA